MAEGDPKPADLKASYGFVALLAKEVPAIGSLLKKAVKGKWTPQRFAMSVANTRWWRQTPASKREWLVTRITDPRTAQREMINGAADIRNRAEVLGVGQGSWGYAKQTWLNAKIRGYEGETLDGYIFRRANLNAGNRVARMERAGGRYGQLISEMGEMAYQYGYTTTKDWEKAPQATYQILKAANKIMEDGGQAQPTAWHNRMKSFAASKYSAFGDRIQAGETVLDIAQPYMQAVSDTLELNPEELGLDDKLVKRAMEGKQALAVHEVERAARQDTRWRKTDNAMESAGEMLTTLGKAFGKVAS